MQHTCQSSSVGVRDAANPTFAQSLSVVHCADSGEVGIVEILVGRNNWPIF